MNASAPGLDSAEARRRLEQYGPNIVPQSKGRSWVRELAAQLTHLLAVLLWVGSALALLAGMPQLAVAIVVIILLNGLFAFWQEHRADRSVEQLRGLMPSGTRVLRDGTPTVVDAAELVPGDAVLLAAGDRVGADLQIATARGLGVDESLVTGESGAVRREAGEPLMAGTFVVQGEAVGVVSATGRNTTLAGITELAGSAVRPPSPLTVQLNRVVRIVAVVAGLTGLSLGLAALGLGLSVTDSFLFGVGVAVALVPEGLLPTVTLSLARGAQTMARRNALVRRLDAVETLGATTYICTDKTGTLTQNRMNVVEVVTSAGTVLVTGEGYEPHATLTGPTAAVAAVSGVARAAATCGLGRVLDKDGTWVADGDPMEAALHCLAMRAGTAPLVEEGARRPYSADRMLSSVLSPDGTVSVLGAPETVLQRCGQPVENVGEALLRLTGAGRRVLAVASRVWTGPITDDMERDLNFLGLVALEDPPRPDVKEALAACRDADIRVAMITGDHPRTAEAIAREIGLLGVGGVVVEASDLPVDADELAALLDVPGGAVVARGTPADKFRIAAALRRRGHVVAMTGDGVNDAPALREADVGVAMGLSGSDVARESADLVLLDDHFASIVAAVELGRATFRNVRRFLTYHLTDNVAELAPFAVWALTGGSFPLAIGVLQVLALDIGTDLLPALALGAEAPRKGIMRGRSARRVVDRDLLVRAFGVLGASEALTALAAFGVVLLSGGWTWGANPDAALLATASGTAFAAIALGQMANAFACRSTVTPVWRMRLFGNPLVAGAVAAEAALLLVFLSVGPVADLLGGGWPSGWGWVLALASAPAVVLADGLSKRSHR